MEAVEYREGQIQCPFDPAHTIRRYKLAGHLRKCEKNHARSKKVRCPFDATHIIDPVEFEHHIDTCPSSGNVRNALYVAEPEVVVGAVPIEQACTNEPVYLDEDWNGDHPTYDPLNQTETRTVTRVLIGASKSERIAFKKAERERLALLDKVENPVLSMPLKEPELEIPLRLPKCISKAHAIGLSPSKTYQDIKLDDNLSDLVNKSLTLSEKNEDPGTPKLKNKPNKSTNQSIDIISALAIDDEIPFVKPEARSKKTMKDSKTKQKVNKENSDVATVTKANTPQKAESCQDASTESANKNNSNKRPLRKPKILCAKEESGNIDGESLSSSDVELNCGPMKYILARQKKTTKACVGRGFALLYNNYKVWEDCEVKEDAKDSMNDYAEKYGYENEI